MSRHRLAASLGVRLALALPMLAGVAALGAPRSGHAASDGAAVAVAVGGGGAELRVRIARYLKAHLGPDAVRVLDMAQHPCPQSERDDLVGGFVISFAPQQTEVRFVDDQCRLATLRRIVQPKSGAADDAHLDGVAYVVARMVEGVTAEPVAAAPTSPSPQRASPSPRRAGVHLIADVGYQLRSALRSAPVQQGFRTRAWIAARLGRAVKLGTYLDYAAWLPATVDGPDVRFRVWGHDLGGGVAVEVERGRVAVRPSFGAFAASFRDRVVEVPSDERPSAAQTLWSWGGRADLRGAIRVARRIRLFAEVGVAIQGRRVRYFAARDGGQALQTSTRALWPQGALGLAFDLGASSTD